MENCVATSKMESRMNPALNASATRILRKLLTLVQKQSSFPGGGGGLLHESDAEG